MASDDDTTVGNEAAIRGSRSSKKESSKKNRIKKKSTSATRSTRSKKTAAQTESDEEFQEDLDEKTEGGSPAAETELTESVVEETIVYQNDDGTSFVEENGIIFNDTAGNCIVEEVCMDVTDEDVIATQEVILSAETTVVNEEEDANGSTEAHSPVPASVDAKEVNSPIQPSSEDKTESVSNDTETAHESVMKTDPKNIIADIVPQEKPHRASKKTSESGKVNRVTVKEEKQEESETTEAVTNTSVEKKKDELEALEVFSKRSGKEVKKEIPDYSEDLVKASAIQLKKEVLEASEDVPKILAKEIKKEFPETREAVKAPVKEVKKEVSETVSKSSTKEAKRDISATSESIPKSSSKERKKEISETKEVSSKSAKDRKKEVSESSKGSSRSSLKSEKETVAKPSADKRPQETTVREENQNASEDKFSTEPETEMVSEDELPNETSKEPLETEAVSDEELPEPVVATDLPETEAVSEDEFPPEKTEREGEREERDRERKRKSDTNKETESSGGGDAETGKKKKRSTESQKRKLIDGDTYDPSSPTSENSCDETPAAKRAALSSGSSSVPKSAAKVRKVLPELEKYWKAVKEDPSDFTGWTYLLQYVDQENDIDAAREAYDAFLSHYPYCYGYWRKYADYEKRKGNKRKCEEVFERGLKAIPLSVDLWIHYLNYCKATYSDDEDHLRCQFEKAISACGMEFRSDRLWESFIKWETEGKRLQNVTALYDKLLTIPTQGYTNHFDNFQEHISSNPPQKVLSVDEFLTLRREVLQLLKQYDQPLPTDDTVPGEETEVPPGEEPEEQPAAKSDEETTALREKIISIRKKIHKTTVQSVAERWNYEEGIKRPYFHVKPLERCQLKNWKEYLDFEIEQGDQTRIVVLFERCLIACALYEEFWIKFIRYLESLKEDMTDKIRNVYERACTIHHTKKPNLHLHWAVFEESQENYDKAAEILTNLEKLVPNMLQVAYRRINLERRRSDLDKVAELYEHYINTSKSKVIANNMAIKYARFSWKILGDTDRAISILNKAVEKDKENPRLYLQLIDMGLQKNPLNEAEIIAIIDQFLGGDADPEQKVLFAQRKVEFLEDFGKDVIGVQKAHDEFQRYFKMAKDRKKKSAEIEGKSDSSSKKAKLQTTENSAASQQASQVSAAAAATTVAATVAAATAGQYAQSSYAQSSGYSQTTATGAAASSSYQSGQYPTTQPPTPYSQPPYNQQYSQSTDPNYANYQNWGYSQTGYGGYNQGWGNYNYY